MDPTTTANYLNISADQSHPPHGYKKYKSLPQQENSGWNSASQHAKLMGSDGKHSHCTKITVYNFGLSKAKNYIFDCGPCSLSVVTVFQGEMVVIKSCSDQLLQSLLNNQWECSMYWNADKSLSLLDDLQPASISSATGNQNPMSCYDMNDDSGSMFARPYRLCVNTLGPVMSY